MQVFTVHSCIKLYIYDSTFGNKYSTLIFANMYRCEDNYEYNKRDEKCNEVEKVMELTRYCKMRSEMKQRTSYEMTKYNTF